MCWPVMIGMAALSAASAAKGSYDQAKMIGAQTTASRNQNQELLKQARWDNASTNLDIRSKFEEASNEITNNNLQAIQTQGAVRAAIGEGMLSGNSMDRIQRVTDGENVRANAMVNENYKRDYASLLTGSVANMESTKGQIDVNQKNEQKGASKLNQALGVGLAGGSGALNSYAMAGKK